MGRIPRSAVIFDRHPLWLSAVGELLSKEHIEVHSTSSEVIAEELLREHRPDVLIFDPQACESVAEEFLRARIADEPDLKALVVSESNQIEKIEAWFEAGAAAYVLNTVQPEDLAVAVRQAFRHTIHWAHSAFHREPLASTNGEPSAVAVLTAREREILSVVAEGKSNNQIARMLWVTEQTVKFHLSNIYRKLGVANRTEASRWAHRHGLTARAETQSAA
jgi:DNA-binding NarL/FixJ family response regulator